MFSLFWWASDIKLLKISMISILLKLPIAASINNCKINQPQKTQELVAEPCTLWSSYSFSGICVKYNLSTQTKIKCVMNPNGKFELTALFSLFTDFQWKISRSVCLALLHTIVHRHKHTKMLLTVKAVITESIAMPWMYIYQSVHGIWSHTVWWQLYYCD